jgi:LacI family transcriptional regulator
MIVRHRPVKLEDIAKELNISKVAVSKALRDSPDISTETIKKVKHLAKKLGYVPNLVARNLSSKKTNTIGLVIPEIAHIFFSSIIKAVYDTASKNNYEIFLTVSQEQKEREKRQIELLLSMKVDGIIVSITQSTKDLKIFKKVIENGIPLIFIDRVPAIEGVSSITVDDIGGAYSAVEYAIKKGYRKIAHLGGYHHINIGKARCEGFIKAMRDYKIPTTKQWITQGGFGEEDGYNGFKKIIKNKKIPEYIFAVTYPVALGLFSAAKELGIRIPEDIEVTCFGNNTFNGSVPSLFNFVDQPASEIGIEAVQLLINQIKKPERFQPHHIELKTQLIINHPSHFNG